MLRHNVPLTGPNGPSQLPSTTFHSEGLPSTTNNDTRAPQQVHTGPHSPKIMPNRPASTDSTCHGLAAGTDNLES
ncbi:hypothetical protein SODALDRAFT_360713 [Sodiomyces alkalinus F11]|uniref:Uncharacterized protein n=1 Tax=Sodiomyces alkalinus (strain CBS 110278 / VKM F-3762 / F11) TaxID=1314773 RepID=A0A3N2PV26_SODAK|nr:hypothetical protein SODALDRAFT_360713 [Sodiomyces alkalinus F11]ROT38345.1 hypothetical protein SODALDRAFT_360713 [Sodiomyces alkalinus F11]